MSRSSRLLSAALCAAVALTVIAAPGFAQAPKAVTKAEAITETAVIEAIDATNRLITLKNDAGLVETIYASSDVRRFDELKVGDKVTFRVLRVGGLRDPAARREAARRVATGWFPAPVRGPAARFRSS